MTEIVVIAALAENNVIGNGPNIPWRISEDFQHFKNKTMGWPCIMGDVTYESLPPNFRPLPGRENIVLTFNKKYHPEGTTMFYAFEDAIKYVNDKGVEKAYITGGASIYKLGLLVAHSLELTRIHKDYEGDVFFPQIDFSQWTVAEQNDSRAEDKYSGEEVDLSFLTYKRIS